MHCIVFPQPLTHPCFVDKNIITNAVWLCHHGVNLNIDTSWASVVHTIGCCPNWASHGSHSAGSREWVLIGI